MHLVKMCSLSSVTPHTVQLSPSAIRMICTYFLSNVCPVHILRSNFVSSDPNAIRLYHGLSGIIYIELLPGIFLPLIRFGFYICVSIVTLCVWILPLPPSKSFWLTLLFGRIQCPRQPVCLPLESIPTWEEFQTFLSGIINTKSLCAFLILNCQNFNKKWNWKGPF